MSNWPTKEIMCLAAVLSIWLKVLCSLLLWRRWNWRWTGCIYLFWFSCFLKWSCPHFHNCYETWYVRYVLQPISMWIYLSYVNMPKLLLQSLFFWGINIFLFLKPSDSDDSSSVSQNVLCLRSGGRTFDVFCYFSIK